MKHNRAIQATSKYLNEPLRSFPQACVERAEAARQRGNVVQQVRFLLALIDHCERHEAFKQRKATAILAWMHRQAQTNEGRAA